MEKNLQSRENQSQNSPVENTSAQTGNYLSPPAFQLKASKSPHNGEGEGLEKTDGFHATEGMVPGIEMPLLKVSGAALSLPGCSISFKGELKLTGDHGRQKLKSDQGTVFKAPTLSLSPVYEEWGAKIFSAEQTIIDFGSGIKASLKGDIGSISGGDKQGKKGKVGLDLAKISLAVSGKLTHKTVKEDNQLARIVRDQPQLMQMLEAGWSLKVTGSIDIKMSAGDAAKLFRINQIDDEIKSVKKHADEAEEGLKKAKQAWQAQKKKYLERTGKKLTGQKATDAFNKTHEGKALKRKVLEQAQKYQKNAKRAEKLALEASRIGSSMKSKFARTLAKVAAKRVVKVAGKILGKAAWIYGAYDTIATTSKLIEGKDHLNFEGEGIKFDDMKPFQEVSQDSGGFIPSQTGTGATMDQMDPNGSVDQKVSLDGDGIGFGGEGKVGLGSAEGKGAEQGSPENSPNSGSHTVKGNGSTQPTSPGEEFSKVPGTGSKGVDPESFSKKAKYLLKTNKGLAALWDLISNVKGALPTQQQAEEFAETFQHITMDEYTQMAQRLARVSSENVDVDEVLDTLKKAYFEIQKNKSGSEQAKNLESKEDEGGAYELAEAEPEGYIALDKQGVNEFLPQFSISSGVISANPLNENGHFVFPKSGEGLRKGDLINMKIRVSYKTPGTQKNRYYIAIGDNLQYEGKDNSGKDQFSFSMDTYYLLEDGRAHCFKAGLLLKNSGRD